MTQSKHMIGQCQWQTTFDEQDNATQLQDALSQWSNLVLPNVLSSIFDRYCPSGQTWRIPQLEINLGNLILGELDSQLPLRVAEAVENALLNMLQQHANSPTGMSSNQLTIVVQSESQLAVLRWFLLYGTTPWWVTGNNSPLHVVDQQLNLQPNAVAALIRDTGKSEAVRRRIVWQWGEARTRQMVHVLEPWNAQFICSYVDNVLLTQRQSSSGLVSDSGLQAHLWYWVLTHLLVERGTLFNTLQFVRSTLWQLAQHYQVTFYLLLEQMSDVAKQMQEEGLVAPQFLQVLVNIRQDELQPRKTQHQADNDTDLWSLFESLLQDKQVSIQCVRQTYYVTELFTRLAQVDPDKMANTLKQVGQQESVRLYIVKQFNEQQLARVVEVVAPREQQFILAHVSHTQALLKEQHLEPELVWRVLLAYLFVNKGSYFNRRQFVHTTLTQVSNHFGVDYHLILLMLQQTMSVPSATGQQYELFAILADLQQQQARQAQHDDTLWLNHYRALLSAQSLQGHSQLSTLSGGLGGQSWQQALRALIMLRPAGSPRSLYSLLKQHRLGRSQTYALSRRLVGAIASADYASSSDIKLLLCALSPTHGMRSAQLVTLLLRWQQQGKLLWATQSNPALQLLESVAFSLINKPQPSSIEQWLLRTTRNIAQRFGLSHTMLLTLLRSNVQQAPSEGESLGSTVMQLLLLPPEQQSTTMMALQIDEDNLPASVHFSSLGYTQMRILAALAKHFSLPVSLVLQCSTRLLASENAPQNLPTQHQIKYFVRELASNLADSFALSQSYVLRYLTAQIGQLTTFSRVMQRIERLPIKPIRVGVTEQKRSISEQISIALQRVGGVLTTTKTQSVDVQSPVVHVNEQTRYEPLAIQQISNALACSKIHSAGLESGFIDVNGQQSGLASQDKLASQSGIMSQGRNSAQWMTQLQLPVGVINSVWHSQRLHSQRLHSQRELKLAKIAAFRHVETLANGQTKESAHAQNNHQLVQVAEQVSHLALKSVHELLVDLVAMHNFADDISAVGDHRTLLYWLLTPFDGGTQLRWLYRLYIAGMGKANSSLTYQQLQIAVAKLLRQHQAQLSVLLLQKALSSAFAPQYVAQLFQSRLTQQWFSPVLPTLWQSQGLRARWCLQLQQWLNDAIHFSDNQVAHVQLGHFKALRGNSALVEPLFWKLLAQYLDGKLSAQSADVDLTRLFTKVDLVKQLVTKLILSWSRSNSLNLPLCIAQYERYEISSEHKLMLPEISSKAVFWQLNSIINQSSFDEIAQVLSANALTKSGLMTHQTKPESREHHANENKHALHNDENTLLQNESSITSQTQYQQDIAESESQLAWVQDLGGTYLNNADIKAIFEHWIQTGSRPHFIAQNGHFSGARLLDDMLLHRPSQLINMLLHLLNNSQVKGRLLSHIELASWLATLHRADQFTEQQITMVNQVLKLFMVLSQAGLEITEAEYKQHIFMCILQRCAEKNLTQLNVEQLLQAVCWQLIQHQVCTRAELSNVLYSENLSNSVVLLHAITQLRKQIESKTEDDQRVPRLDHNEQLIFERALLEKKASQNEQPTEFPISVPNAGLVLLQSFISHLFERLELINDDKFVSEDKQRAAVHYLQFLVTGQSATEEHHLILNKLLCGHGVTHPLEAGITLTQREIDISHSLIDAVCNYWPAIGKTTVDGFRGNWLVRNGTLTEAQDHWDLIVEKRVYDILISRSPLSYSIVKLPWMEKPIYVTWPT